MAIIISLLILTPHFYWLIKNNFVTILYGFKRTSLIDSNLIDHFKNSLFFIFKQIGILFPVFIMMFTLLKKFRFKINLKNKKTFFLISINVIPFLLILMTAILTGAKIRTMWMTPFYLFFGVLVVDILKKNIQINSLRKFYLTFLFFLILSPSLYLGISLYDNAK